MNGNRPPPATRPFRRETCVVVPSLVSELDGTVWKIAPRQHGYRVDDPPQVRIDSLRLGESVLQILSAGRRCDVCHAFSTVIQSHRPTLHDGLPARPATGSRVRFGSRSVVGGSMELMRPPRIRRPRDESVGYTGDASAARRPRGWPRSLGQAVGAHDWHVFP